MDKTLVIFSALLVVSLIVGAGMFVTSAGNTGFTKESAIDTATQFVNGEATYKYDGMHETLTTDAMKAQLETNPAQEVYLVLANFTSRQAGYGDRSGMMSADVLTPHTCEIAIDQGGNVLSAVMDDQWDMVKQQMIASSACPKYITH